MTKSGEICIPHSKLWGTRPRVSRDLRPCALLWQVLHTVRCVMHMFKPFTSTLGHLGSKRLRLCGFSLLSVLSEVMVMILFANDSRKDKGHFKGFDCKVAIQENAKKNSTRKTFSFSELEGHKFVRLHSLWTLQNHAPKTHT